MARLALTLGVLAVIALAAIYLYHAVVSPAVAVVSTVLSSGKWSSSLTNILASIITFGLLLATSQYFFQKMAGLVSRVSDMFEELSKEVKQLRDSVSTINIAIRLLDRRIEALESAKVTDERI